MDAKNFFFFFFEILLDIHICFDVLSFLRGLRSLFLTASYTLPLEQSKKQ